MRSIAAPFPFTWTDNRLVPHKLISDEEILREGGEPLDMYLTEVEAVPPVDEKREAELLHKIATAAPDALLAKKELVEAHLDLVVLIATGYRTSECNILDLIERGNLGLFQAVDNYQAGIGVNFASYASSWVRKVLDDPCQ